MLFWLHRVVRYGAPVLALALLVLAMGGTWATVPPAGASPLDVTAAESAERPPVHRAAPAAPAASPAVPRPSATATAKAKAPRRRDGELTGTIDLNTATAEELERLPTIGPAKAERIVVWRQKNGAFRRIADLRHVKGIGYKTFKRLEPFLAIQGPTTLGYASPSPSPKP
jgi:competence protein ComEA